MLSEKSDYQGINALQSHNITHTFPLADTSALFTGLGNRHAEQHYHSPPPCSFITPPEKMARGILEQTQLG